ncbi:VOC family protein [Sphingomonas sp.]|uniref:VOC family protein n=1 Tax=Sphingomonas sp. TaxID=28214 RepID=UPI0017F64631|nr:VOC family protein [Sphingomonas sp.]MBA3510783.1 VOC family protein [Sphingomonas sp.]
MANPIPEGYHSVTPYIIVDDAKAAIDFYARAFGASEKFRLPMGDKIGHAELQIGDSVVMLADEFPERDIRGPKARGGATSSLMIYVDDVDSVFQRAIDAGGRADGEGVKDQFYGDRSGTLVDPFGHKWTIATHVEDVPDDELQRRMQEFSTHKQSEPA